MKLSDTAAEADRVLIDVYRRMPPNRKWQVLGDAYCTARALHATGYRARNPGATDAAVWADWLALTLPDEDRPVTPPPDPNAPHLGNLAVIREVLDVFDRLGVACAVGGSLASSLHGVPRFTQDADLTAEPFPGRESEFAAAFGPDYYVSQSAVAQANRDRSSFNVIHTVAGFKVDVFIRKDRPFDRSLMQRCVGLTVVEPGEKPLPVVSAEDVILLKLEWYRLGGEMSDRQWGDILGVCKVQGGRLDTAYLEKFADQLGVRDLWDSVKIESGLLTDRPGNLTLRPHLPDLPR
jgi:hypothetical protein